MAIIPLNTTAVVTLQPLQQKAVTTLTISRLVILPEQKIIRAFVNEFSQPILLLSGASYDAYMGTAAPMAILAALTANLQAQAAGAGLVFG